MNLRSQFKKVLEEIKKREEHYNNLIEQGSKNIQDNIEGAYYSGLHNGFNFVWFVLDNNLTQEEFDELVNDLFKTEVVN